MDKGFSCLAYPCTERSAPVLFWYTCIFHCKTTNCKSWNHCKVKTISQYVIMKIITNQNIKQFDLNSYKVVPNARSVIHLKSIYKCRRVFSDILRIWKTFHTSSRKSFSDLNAISNEREVDSNLRISFHKSCTSGSCILHCETFSYGCGIPRPIWSLSHMHRKKLRTPTYGPPSCVL